MTDGSMYNGLVIAGEQAAPWYQGGHLKAQIASRKATLDMLWATPDIAASLARDALDKANLSCSSVDFYAAHQGTVWFRKLTQAFSGLDGARSVDTFPWAAGLMSCNIPLVLHTAWTERMLNRGDVVLMHAGGSGITASTVVVKWANN